MSEQANAGIDVLLARTAESVTRAGYSLHRASVCLLTDDGSALRFVSVWGTSSDAIFPGVVLRVGATSFPEVVRADGPVTATMVQESLAGEVVRQEGVRAWITVPLRQ